MSAPETELRHWQDIRLRVGGVLIRFHPLAVLAPLAAARLGLPGEARALAPVLLCHEGAHLLAARLLGVRVNALTLTPVGGTLDLGNPYALAPGRLFAVALAGPLGSLAAAMAAGALCQTGLLGPEAFLCAARVNLALMLFNLLPALPLDGGRMLYAALSPRLGRDAAARLGVRSGIAVSALLAAFCLFLWRQAGRINLSPLLAAVFLLAALPGERRALTDMRVESMLNALRPAGAPVPVRLWAVGGRCSAGRALRALAPDAAALFAVYEGGRLRGFVDDRQLLAAATDGRASAAVSVLLHGSPGSHSC